VLATSYLDEAERASQVLALDAGRELAAGTPEQIVAAMPGTVRVMDSRPVGDAARRAWRRNARWRVWVPDDPAAALDGLAALAGPAAADGRPEAALGEPVQADLQDAVTVASLARELAMSGGDQQ
jgi:ABC-2 type transport system ATP-binding protein